MQGGKKGGGEGREKRGKMSPAGGVEARARRSGMGGAGGGRGAGEELLAVKRAGNMQHKDKGEAQGTHLKGKRGAKEPGRWSTGKGKEDAEWVGGRGEERKEDRSVMVAERARWSIGKNQRNRKKGRALI